MFCSECGKELSDSAVFCVDCGAVIRKKVSGEASSKKVAAGIFGLLLGAFGVHKFYLGYTKEGLIMLLVSLLTCGMGASIISIIGFVEGIIYLTKDDAGFEQTYMIERRGWF